MTTAVESVVRAGQIMLEKFGTDVRVDMKGAIDLVTEVDIAIEREFRIRIAERFPDHAVLGEEMGGSATPPSGPCWVFDPIDGTTNFAHGLPIFCSSLALNGRPMHVSSPPTLLESVLVTGFPYDVHARVAEIVGLFAEFVGRARAVRRLGSAAIDLCYVAAGRLDGFWERDLKPWDIAGGALLVTEAGGTITNFRGEMFHSRGRDVVASNGHIHQAMLDVISGHAASNG